MPAPAIHMPMHYGLIYQVDPSASTIGEIADHVRYRKTKPNTAEITLISDRVELIIDVRTVEPDPNDDRLINFTGHVLRATLDGRPLEPSLSGQAIEGAVCVDGQYGNLKLLGRQ